MAVLKVAPCTLYSVRANAAARGICLVLIFTLQLKVIVDSVDIKGNTSGGRSLYEISNGAGF